MTIQEIQLIQPDEKGHIILNVNGEKRRYVKEILIKKLQENGGVIKTASANKIPSVKKEKKQPTEKRKAGRPVNPNKVATVKGPRGSYRRMPVIAILPDGTEKPFPSCASASRELGIYKCGIHRVLKGKFTKVNSIGFRLADKVANN